LESFLREQPDFHGIINGKLDPLPADKQLYNEPSTPLPRADPETPPTFEAIIEHIYKNADYVPTYEDASDLAPKEKAKLAKRAKSIDPKHPGYSRSAREAKKTPTKKAKKIS